jgi:hypothetical protein
MTPMSELAQKVKNSLDEARLFGLAVQVFLGFQMRAPFEPRFTSLAQTVLSPTVAGLGLLWLTFVLVVAPTPFSEIAFRAETSTRIQTFTSRMLTIALVPFAGALMLSVFVAMTTIVSTVVAWGIAAAFVGTAAWWWFGFALLQRRTPKPKRPVTHDSALTDRVQQVLTEARMVLPGAQALLGFQLATFLMEAFDRLPMSLKRLHAVSLGLVALATILVMAPAAFHRIAENGEDSERVADFGARMVLTALAPLACGLVIDGYVVLTQASVGPLIAVGLPAAFLATAVSLWAVYPFMVRRRRRTRV